MVKPIPLLAAGIGFTAQPSVFAADPTPSPSPVKAAVSETASPNYFLKSTHTGHVTKIQIYEANT
jgi:hypothetical protein